MQLFYSFGLGVTQETVIVALLCMSTKPQAASVLACANH
jgi:hypothetical protein